MENYVLSFGKVWKSVMDSLPNKGSVDKDSIKGYGPVSLYKDAEVDENGRFAIGIEVADVEKQYLSKADKRLREALVDSGDFNTTGKGQSITGAATLGFAGDDYVRHFYSGNNALDTALKMLSKGQKDFAYMSVSHRRQWRGKGNARIFVAAPSKEKVKEYVTEVLKAIQAGI